MKRLKNEKGFSLVELLMVLGIGFCILVGPLGWGLNLWKLTKCDFESPLKAEIIRGVGVVAFPVGIIAGYLSIDDTKPEIKK